MELDAFTEALGTRQGRVRQGDSPVLVLGDIEARRVHALSEGDFVEWEQLVDLTNETLLRIQGGIATPTDLPDGWTWEVSLTVDGAKYARLRATPGRAQRVDDLTAYVRDLTGLHRVAVRLELVRDG